jgi:alanyl-tRNA synthetase
LEGYNFEIFTTNHELAKTDSAFYEKLIEEKSLNLDECFYVEHVQEHVDTAKKIGIKSELFTDTSKSIDSIKANLFSFKKADQQNVDTGMGLERITAVLNGKKSVYDTDIFTYIIEKIESTLGVKYTPETMKSIRIIADHSRSAMIMISDGITPSNVDQGYVLRRLIRRAIREAYKLDYKGEFIAEIVEVIIENYKEVFKNVGERKDIILEELRIEEKQFLTTLEKGLKEFEKLVKGFAIAFERSGKKVTEIAGPKAFKLYDTFGFPIEMTVELAEERGLTVDTEGFKKAFEEHQAKSRA